jgi:mRNA deadenylase 3'-5' endonuclease subunit Ccr4
MSELDGEQLFIYDSHQQVGTTYWTEGYCGSINHIIFMPAAANKPELYCIVISSPL